MDRRTFLLASASLAAACNARPRAPLPNERRLAITIDDPTTDEMPHFGVEERNRAILEQLAARRTRVMLFVCGKRVDSARGASLLAAFHDAGHLLANHSYSHRNYGE